MLFPLIKASASGNTFIIIDTRYHEISSCTDIQKQSFLVDETFLKTLISSSFEQRKKQLDLIQEKFCFQSKFDGLCIIRASESYDFTCDFFNRDGSIAEFCGNATCALACYEDKLNHKISLCFKLGKEDVTTFKKEGCFWIQFKDFQKPIKKTTLFHDKEIHYFFIHTGVPHGVLRLETPPHPEKLRELAIHLREEGDMNVSFFQLQEDGSVEALSYERGVEDFTLACGTGALAIALTLECENLHSHLNILSLKMPGGKLRVQLKPDLAFSSNPKLGH